MGISLHSPIGSLFMVGPAYQKKLKKLDIETVEDLIYHAPHRYHDYRNTVSITESVPKETSVILGTILECKNSYTRSGKVLQKLKLQDDTGILEVLWFNQPYIPNSIKDGQEIAVAGKVEIEGRNKVMISPEYEVINPKNPNRIHTQGLVPIYPETAGVSSKWLRSRISPILKEVLPTISDWLPQDIRKEENLLSLQEALSLLHFPKNHTDEQQSRTRLAFDEMLSLQLANQLRRNSWKQKSHAYKLPLSTNQVESFKKTLPFTLTSAQQKVSNELIKDLNKTTPMNRLLQGDVGSGKTVIAALGMYASVMNHKKSVIMAPTEILAMQHYRSISELSKCTNAKVSLCTGSTKTIDKDSDIIIGTHALLFNSLNTNDIAFLVIDEQHRFGVEQRSQLVTKSHSPHLLTMTATPIPRTVALTFYGDLDLSILNEMPPGRIPIKTWVVPHIKRLSAYEWIVRHCSKGQQAFIICPLIEESEHESMESVRAATKEFEILKNGPLKSIRLGLLHGRMKAKEKEIILSQMAKQEIDCLITTPVVEVGIDIPNATIMVIEGAERFGLAQIHQLRGRVGRNQIQSYCLLFPSTKTSSSLKRLKALETTTSGLTLAELDLKVRGPGELYGIRQHGFSLLKFASITDIELISKTRTYATKILEERTYLDNNPQLKAKLSALEKPVEPN